MNRTLVRLSTALATVTVATLGVTGVAGATSSDTSDAPITVPARLDVAKARCTAAVDRRLAHITVLEGRLGAPAVTASHRAALTTALEAARAGLSGLKGPIAAAPDKATLKPLCQSITVDYRIYLFRTPQVDRVVALDVESTALGELGTKATGLQGRIDTAKAAGKNTARAEQALAKMNTEITAGHTSSDGVADTVVGFTVAQWNANHALLNPAKQAVTQTHRHVLKARAFAAATERALNRL